MAEAKEIGDVYGAVYKEFGKACSIGVHLHAPFSQARDRVSAAFQAGCMRFDATLGGYGGCPMASDALIGNIPMEVVVDFLERKRYTQGLIRKRLREVSVWQKRFLTPILRTDAPIVLGEKASFCIIVHGY